MYTAAPWYRKLLQQHEGKIIKLIYEVYVYIK